MTNNNNCTQHAVKIIFEITGKSAHAAYSHGSINAVSVASKAITECEKAKQTKEINFNIFSVNGGKATNVVPDKCIAEILITEKNLTKPQFCSDIIISIFTEICTREKAKLKYTLSDLSDEKEDIL